MIADSLKDAEQVYPARWIEEAMQISVQSNKRSWRYVEAILRKWKESGRDEETRRGSEKDRRKYVEGDYSDFIEH
jgi:DNA replication protein DnaD